MEQWRKVPGFETYGISIETREGQCKNLKTGKILSNKPSKSDGRIYWCLGYCEKPQWQQAARWIALTYPELVENEYFEGAEIDHKDTVRLNNHPFNLRWVTRRQNLNNPLTRKHNSDSQKKEKPFLKNRKDLSKSVAQYKDDLLVNTFPSTMEAERQTGVHHSHITKCCNGKYKQAGGYTWKYVTE